jgi:hypothetical protein
METSSSDFSWAVPLCRSSRCSPMCRSRKGFAGLSPWLAGLVAKAFRPAVGGVAGNQGGGRWTLARVRD